jgi:hypothetical protein
LTRPIFLGDFFGLTHFNESKKTLEKLVLKVSNTNILPHLNTLQHICKRENHCEILTSDRKTMGKKVFVKVIEAGGISTPEQPSSCSVRVRLGKKTWRTKKIKDKYNPKWDETFSFPVKNGQTSLEVAVFNKKDMVGKVEVADVTQFSNEQEFRNEIGTGWILFTVHCKEEEKSGASEKPDAGDTASAAVNASNCCCVDPDGASNCSNCDCNCDGDNCNCDCDTCDCDCDCDCGDCNCDCDCDGDFCTIL